MDWITKEQVKEAAKDKMSALYCSLKHHKQGRDCTRGELVDALDEEAFALSSHYCACCQKFDGVICEKGNECPLRVSLSKGGTIEEICCGGLWDTTDRALFLFDANSSLNNFRDFQQAESKVCDYIQGVIDVLEAEEKVKPPLSKPKLRHGDYKVNNSGGVQVIVKHTRSEALRLIQGDGLFKGSATGWGLISDSDTVRKGNIFDDIAERGKELERFEVMGGKTFGFKAKVKNGEININNCQSGDRVYTLDEAKEIHTKLGQVINFAENKAKRG